MQQSTPSPESSSDEVRSVETYRDEQYVPEDDTISLLDLLSVLAKRWKLIFFSTFFAGLFMVGLSLYTILMPPDSAANPLPNVYKPEVLVLLRETQGSDLSSILNNSGLGALGNLAGISGGGGGTSSAQFAMSLLEQNTILDEIVEEFGIIERNGFDENPRQSARNFVRNNMEAEFASDTGILTISFEHIDPVFATNIVNFAVDVLEQRFRSLNADQAADRLTVARERLADIEQDLRVARDRLIAFQRENGILEPESAAQQTTQVTSAFVAELYQKELELQNQLELSPDSARVRVLRNEIAQIRQFLREADQGWTTFSGEIPSQDELSALTAEFIELRGEAEILATVYQGLRSQVETIQIEAADNSRQFQIIEEAEVPVQKDSPSRSIITVIVTVTVFFLAVFLAFVLEYFSKVQRDPVESEKLEEIRRAFGAKRRES